MDPRRRRRRQRRAGAVAAFMVLALGIAFFFESQATTTVIIVRYADVAPGLGDDLGLSPVGAIRAEELSRVLGDVDVIQGPDAILVWGGRPSRETAEPLARRLNLPVLEVDSSSLTRLAKRIMKDYKGQIVVVVAEPADIPVFIPRFQGSKKVPELADEEADNIYVVSVPWYGKVKTLRFRYGARLAPAGDENGLAAR
jgi:2,3-bisphosphoglycerate-dependent phosphoglycerate mutase